MQRFDAPWDRTLIISTLVALALILVTAVTGAGAALRAGMNGFGVAIALVCAGIAIGAWALAPRAFEVGSGRLRILRNGWPAASIALRDVRVVGPVERAALRGALRLFGTGGLFGYYGLFRSPLLGTFWLHATRSDELVIVRTARHTYVLTPEPLERFLAAVLSAAPDAKRERIA